MTKRMPGAVALALCLTLLLTACGGAAGGAGGSAANYADVIWGARSDEENSVFYIVADPATHEGAAATASSAPTSELDAQQHDMLFNDATGFSAEPMEKYAISVGFSITQAYGIAVVLPKEGQEQAVTDMLNGYVLSQQKAQENYLPGPYAIAMAAEVKTAPTGEVLLAMCKNQSEVIAAMEAALRA